MDLANLHNAFTNLESNGHVLPLDLKTALATSLHVLQANYKLTTVQFWGKVLGTSNDYLIACGYKRDYFSPKKFFYRYREVKPISLPSQNGVDWAQLPELDPEISQICGAMRTLFTGDPSFETKMEVQSNDGESSEDVRHSTRTIVISEERRLVHVVREIDHDTSVVPRGAFTLTAQKLVVRNPSFQGLNFVDAQNLKSYGHLRQPLILPRKSLLEKEGLNRTLDFMDTLDEDIPKESWGMVVDHVSRRVTLRSFLWPGYCVYHVAGTPNHGACYIGNGIRNSDLGFMV